MHLRMRCIHGFHVLLYQQELTGRDVVSLCRANIPLIPAESSATEVTDIPSDVSSFKLRYGRQAAKARAV